MFRLRPDHLAGLSSQQTEGFLQRMAAHLRQEFASEVDALDKRELDAVVRKGCQLAEQWGITDEEYVERILELFVSFPVLRQFEPPPWLEETVSYPGRSGEHKLLRIEDRLLFGEND